MYKFKELIPPTLYNYYRLLKIRKFYKGNRIFSSNIEIGADIGEQSFISEGVFLSKEIKIGSYSYVNSNTLIFSGSIGNFCSISYSCIIGPPNHPTNYISTSPFIYGGNNIFGTEEIFSDNEPPPVIGSDVWIGANVFIKRGVKIGNGAIIGAGSIVLKDVEPFAIVGGVPAKPIRKRFSDKKIEYLENLKWWELPKDELKEVQYLFKNSEKWI